MAALTVKELAVLQAIDDSEYGDLLTDAVWTFSIADNVALNIVPVKGIPGVVASLNKKGFLVSVKDSDGDCVYLTDAGVKAFLETNGSSKKRLAYNQ